MIYIGLDTAAKARAVQDYCRGRRIDRVYVLSPERFYGSFVEGAEVVEWKNIIEYKFFYRLLQEIDQHTLVVVNECLRLQNRNDLTYNCMRHYLAQAGHQIIFQHLPIIDEQDDFMILFDFDTKSRWKRTKFKDAPLGETEVVVGPHVPTFAPVDVPIDDRLRQRYQKRKRELIDNIGLRDPHTIPRNLYLLGGKAKAAHIDPWAWHIGRNQRLRLERFTTYRAESFTERYTVIELPHDFRRFIDFATLSQPRQTEFGVLTTELKVDQWYLQRYQDWSRRVHDACAAIQR